MAIHPDGFSGKTVSFDLLGVSPEPPSRELRIRCCGIRGDRGPGPRRTLRGPRGAAAASPDTLHRPLRLDLPTKPCLNLRSVSLLLRGTPSRIAPVPTARDHEEEARVTELVMAE